MGGVEGDHLIAADADALKACAAATGRASKSPFWFTCFRKIHSRSFLVGFRNASIAQLRCLKAHCIFERNYAEALGMDVESGRAQRFRTMTGSFVAYEHEVILHTLGIEFSTVVFFAHDPAFSKNFAGRSGWLDRLRVGIIDYDRLLFLSAYDS